MRVAKTLNTIFRATGLKSISSQFLFAFILIIALSCTAAGVLYTGMSASVNTVNVAGKQRMLSQRLAKEVLFVAQGAENSVVVDKTINLFETTLVQLIQGDPVNGIDAPPSEVVTAQLKKVQILWKGYKQTVQEYMVSKDPVHLAGIHAQSLSVLKEMNIAVGMMADHAAEISQMQGLVQLLATLGILITALISGLCGMPWLMRQLKEVSLQMEKVGKGDYTGRIVADCSDNEVGAMVSAFNSMLDNNTRLIATVQKLSSGVSARSNELLGSSDEAEINSNKQNQEIECVSTAMNEMSASINEVALNASNAAEAAVQASGSAGKGRQVISETTAQIQGMAEQLESASSVMTALDADSQEIGNVLTVITGIAEQTNLLALNAAIEAARAGDQGRGFAVVADEVRTLAQRTQHSTEEIRSIIERLQAQSSKAVSVMSIASEQINKNINKVSEAGTAIADIVTAVDMINQMNAQIATAAEEQSHVSQEMDRNMVSISTASSDFMGVCGNVRHVAEALSDESKELNKLVSSFKLS